MLTGLEKRLHRGLPDAATAASPPLLTLERFLFRLIAVGFVLLTLTLVSGIFFSEQLFGKPLAFTHKNVFSVLAGSRSRPALRPLALRLARAHGAEVDPGRHRAAAPRLSRQQVRAGGPAAPLSIRDKAAAHPLTGNPTSLGRHPASTLGLALVVLLVVAGLLLDRRDRDDGRQSLPAEASRATRRSVAHGSRWRCWRRPTRCSACILLGNNLINAAAAATLTAVITEAPVRRGRAGARARHASPSRSLMLVFSEITPKVHRRRARRPPRAAGQLRADADAARLPRRSCGSSTCSCRGC